MIISLDSLFEYCKEKNISNFQADSPENELIVSIPATFEQDENYDDEFYLKGRFKACHTKRNFNNSYIEDEVMESKLSTFREVPVLASFIETTDKDGNSTLDFNGHDMVVADDKMNSGEKRIEYIEQMVGIIPFNNNAEMVKDEKSDKKYVYVDGYIFKDYTYAADILQKRGGASVSVELALKSFSYNAKENYLNIEDFRFKGITLLGASVKPGMEGAEVNIETFADKQYSHDDKTMINIMSELKEALDNFNKLNKETMEGGKDPVNKFEELLAKYSVTAEEVEFDVEGLSDEELEAKFAEVFGEEGDGEDTPSDGEGEDETTPEDDNTGDDDGDEGDKEDTTVTETEACGDKKKKKASTKCSAETEVTEVKFELSHDDIRYGLYQLLRSYEEADNDCYYINSVYDDHFVYQSWQTGNYYGQKYSKDGEAVSFEDERYELFAEMLTASEKAALEDMRTNYTALEEKVASYEANAEKAEKEAVLNSEDYAELSEDENFAKLKKDMDKYSLDEIKTKAELCFAAHVRKAGEYKTSKPQTYTKVAGKTDVDEGYRPYGNAVSHPVKKD